MGRPSDYSIEIADEICEKIASGGALYLLCDEIEHWPSEATVYRWLEKYPEFCEKYARSRERQGDREFDEIKSIADTATDAHLARIRIDARRWRAAKLAPKKYGEKITNEHTGADGGPIQIVTGVPRDETD